MQPHLRTLAGVLTLAALMPATASAQNLAEDVFTGSVAPATVPITVGTGSPVKTIKSQDDARAARIYDLVPPNMLVNWDFDQVMMFLAVDARTSGPGRVSIEVQRKSMFSTSWFSLHYLDVKVTRFLRAPGTIGLPAAIRPYALVKMPRSDDLVIPRVVTENLGPPGPPPPAAAFTEITRRTEEQLAAINWTGPGGMPNPHTNLEDVRIRSNGEVKISRWSSPGMTGISPITGTATQGELRALAQAITRARFNDIPIDLGSGLPLYTFRVLGLPGGDRKIQGVRGQEGTYKARLDAVHAAMDAIRDRVAGTTPPPPPAGLGFTQIERRRTSSPLIQPQPTLPGLPTPMPPYPTLPSSTVSTEVMADGAVTISRWSTPGLTGTPPITGTATQAELKDLSKAIRLARFHEIPQDLGGWAHDSFSFRVIGTPQGDRKISGSPGSEGQYRARLKAVHDAIDAIQRRVEQANRFAFDLVSRKTDFPLKRQERSLLIQKNGDATLRIAPRAPMLEPAPRSITGKLTRSELRRLNDAVRAAKLSTVPNKLPTPVHIVAGNMFHLKVSAFSSDLEGDVKGEIGYYTSYATQLTPTMDLLDAIEKRLELQNRPNPYLEITQATTTPDKIDVGQELVIEVKGIRSSVISLTDIETKWKSIETLPPTWELTVNAVGKYNVNVGDAGITAGFSKTLRVQVPDNEAGKVSIVFNTEFQNGSARFERGVQVGELKDRAQGIVSVRRAGNGYLAVWLRDGTRRTRVLPTSFARTLVKFEGHEVIVAGKQNGVRMRADTLVSPTRKDIQGNVSVAGGQVTIQKGWTPFPPGPVPMPPVIPFHNDGPSNTSILPPLERYTVVDGGAKAVVEKANGLRVTADAWVFENARRPWTATKALVVGVRGTVLEDSNLTRRGRKVNSVKQGEQVLVTRLSNSGDNARVEPKTGRAGYMPLDKVELGDRIFTIQPAAGDNPGLSGSLGNATGN